MLIKKECQKLLSPNLIFVVSTPLNSQRNPSTCPLLDCYSKRFYDIYGKPKRPRFRIPTYVEHGHRGHGWPLMWVVTATKPSWQPHLEEEYEVVARDEFGVPMQVTRTFVYQ